MDDEMTMMTRLPCLYFQIQIKIWRETTPFRSEKKKFYVRKASSNKALTVSNRSSTLIDHVVTRGHCMYSSY